MATSPFLIADHSADAQKLADQQQQEALPIVNAVLSAWRAQGFPRNITTQEDLQDLLGYTDERITEERKKLIPAAISFLNPDKALTLIDEAPSLLSLRAAAAAARSTGIRWDLIRYNGTSQLFEMNPTAVTAYVESHKHYATGKQVEAITALEQVRDGLNELLALGIHFTPRTLIATTEYTSYQTPLISFVPTNTGTYAVQVRDYQFSKQINP